MLIRSHSYSKFYLLFAFILCCSNLSLAEDTAPAASENKSTSPTPAVEKGKDKVINISDYCFETLKAIPGSTVDAEALKKACEKAKLKEDCTSRDQKPIFHVDKESPDPKAKKILTISLIHGDETFAGTMARLWLERLESISPRNSWRIIPMANPDGYKLKTRANANGVDLNRNFPTTGWDKDALDYWKKKMASNPRRFPGNEAASEPETKCLMAHIEEFKPDFIISIHTPLKVLDFDGPKVHFPKYDYLPWTSLGNFPGSLGRYMWVDNKKPVLTVELKDTLPSRIENLIDLQDATGALAILALEAQKQAPTKIK